MSCHTDLPTNDNPVWSSLDKPSVFCLIMFRAELGPINFARQKSSVIFTRDWCPCYWNYSESTRHESKLFLYEPRNSKPDLLGLLRAHCRTTCCQITSAYHKVITTTNWTILTSECVSVFYSDTQSVFDFIYFIIIFLQGA